MFVKTTALYSRYIIDGVPQELTPAEVLDAVLETPQESFPDAPETVVDETVDQVLGTYEYDAGAVDKYLSLVCDTERKMPLAFAEGFIRSRIAQALLDALWRKGHFRIGDLALDIRWRWSDREVGNMAAFYSSVLAAGDYIDGLSVKLHSYKYERVSGECGVAVKALLSSRTEDDELIGSEPFRAVSPRLSSAAAVPQTFVSDPQSWIIYIPFDTSEFRLGGSLLTQALGFGGGVHPPLEDTDYFLDCYEVVRELVEDGIVEAAATVGDGGLLAALKRMLPAGVDVSANISDIISSYQESNIVRILFAEVPGVIIQIKDQDFDYVDAELLLQDVQYFPLGHPVPGEGGIKVNASAKSGIETILESLIRNQGAEGED